MVNLPWNLVSSDNDAHLDDENPLDLVNLSHVTVNILTGNMNVELISFMISSSPACLSPVELLHIELFVSRMFFICISLTRSSDGLRREQERSLSFWCENSHRFGILS